MELNIRLTLLLVETIRLERRGFNADRYYNFLTRRPRSTSSKTVEMKVAIQTKASENDLLLNKALNLF
jgi:hypothetical protein